jgi:hypothetical protein
LPRQDEKRRILRCKTLGLLVAFLSLLFNVTEKTGLADSGYDMGVAVGDYDNDGYADIFVAGVYRNTLYHNNGDGLHRRHRKNRAQQARRRIRTAMVGRSRVDANNDGLLDLILINYLTWDVDREPLCEAQKCVNVYGVGRDNSRENTLCNAG